MLPHISSRFVVSCDSAPRTPESGVSSHLGILGGGWTWGRQCGDVDYGSLGVRLFVVSSVSILAGKCDL